MGFASFFKKPEYKRFNIQPRYWDPAKEERQDRERRMKSELGIKDENVEYIPNIKGRMRSELRHKHMDTSSVRRSSNIRLLLIFIILALAAFIYINGWDEVLQKIIVGIEQLKSNR